MNKQSLLLAGMLAAAALGVGACKKPAPAKAPASAVVPATSASPAAPLPAFSHDASLEVFGYYLPTAPVAVDQFRLHDLSLGTEEEFKNWEGGHRMASYGPAMLEFDDTSSAKTTAETGAEGYAETIRVLPDRYSVNSNEVSFDGHDAKLGAVSFRGRFDAHGFAAAKRGDAPQTVVLVGELKAGGKSFPDTRFTWFGGD